MSENPNRTDEYWQRIRNQWLTSVKYGELQEEAIRSAISEATELSADYIRKIVKEELAKR